jgi:hypothetical protein
MRNLSAPEAVRRVSGPPAMESFRLSGSTVNQRYAPVIGAKDVCIEGTVCRERIAIHPLGNGTRKFINRYLLP